MKGISVQTVSVDIHVACWNLKHQLSMGQGNSKVLQTCQAFSFNIAAWLQSQVIYFQCAIFQRAIYFTFDFELSLLLIITIIKVRVLSEMLFWSFHS